MVLVTKRAMFEIIDPNSKQVWIFIIIDTVNICYKAVVSLLFSNIEGIGRAGSTYR